MAPPYSRKRKDVFRQQFNYSLAAGFSQDGSTFGWLTPALRCSNGRALTQLRLLPLKWSNSAFGLGQVPICPLTFILSPLWGEGRERGTRPAPSWVPKALPSRDSGPMLAIVTTDR